MHTKNVRMRPVPLWGRCTGSTDFTSRKKNTRKTNGATKQHSMRDQRQLWKSFSSSFASFEFTTEVGIFGYPSEDCGSVFELRRRPHHHRGG